MNTTLACPSCGMDELMPRAYTGDLEHWTEDGHWCPNCRAIVTDPIEVELEPDRCRDYEREEYLDACDRARQNMKEEGSWGTGRLS